MGARNEVCGSRVARWGERLMFFVGVISELATGLSGFENLRHVLWRERLLRNRKPVLYRGHCFSGAKSYDLVYLLDL